MTRLKWIAAALSFTTYLGAASCGGEHSCSAPPCPAPGNFDQATCSCISSAPPTATAGSGGAGTALPACPGATPLTEQVTCRTSSDCASGYRCAEPGTPVCAGITAPVCLADGDCAGGQICVLASDPCGGFECAAACTAASCASDEECAADGHCQPVACSAGYTCAAGSQCQAGVGADAHGCSVPRCDATGACPENEVCDPTSSTPDGCVARSCASDADCDCGACIMGQCQNNLFVCIPALL